MHTMACSALPLEIAQHKLIPCHYFKILCRKDGEIRVGAADALSGDSYQCPICHTLCYSSPLGEGGTLRPMPFWNRIQDAHSFTAAANRLWLDLKDSRRV